MKKTLTNILRNSLLAGSLTLGGIASDGCYNRSDKLDYLLSPTDSKQDFVEEKKDIPTLEDFKRVLGKERLERMTEEDNKKLEEFWKNKNNEGRKFFYGIYRWGEQVIRKVDWSEDPLQDIKSAYKKFDPFSLPLSEIKEYETKIPWKLIPDNFNLQGEDKTMLFILHYIHKGPLEIKDIDIFTGKFIF